MLNFAKTSWLSKFSDMGSVGNPISNPYTTYDNYRDCSLGICSIYCPQFCYLIFPPPPPPSDDGTPFSPLIIAIIGVLASAFILVSYYTIVTRYCKRRSVVHSSSNQENDHQTSHDQFQTGLDEGQIKTITVLKYRKGEGLVDGSECAVCLGEFQENESLRLLPKCDHAFHLPCIDTWLKSHSNCPLCRANAVPSPLPPLSSAREMNCYEINRPDDLILVVDHQEMHFGREVVVVDGDESGNVGNGQEGVEKLERSVSLGSFSSERRLLVSDILKVEDVDEDLQVKGVGSSKGRDVEIKRSISSDRFMFSGHGKGKSSVLPH